LIHLGRTIWNTHGTVSGKICAKNKLRHCKSAKFWLYKSTSILRVQLRSFSRAAKRVGCVWESGNQVDRIGIWLRFIGPSICIRQIDSWALDELIAQYVSAVRSQTNETWQWRAHLSWFEPSSPDFASRKLIVWLYGEFLSRVVWGSCLPKNVTYILRSPVLRTFNGNGNQ